MSIVNVEHLSTFVRALNEGRGETSHGVKVRPLSGGYNDFLDLRNNGKIAAGQVLFIIRTMDHHVRQEVVTKTVPIVTDIWVRLLRPRNLQKLNKYLREKGMPAREYAYIHACVLVGKDRDLNWYVVENAGGDEHGMGELRFYDVFRAFNDSKTENSCFFVMNTPNPSLTAQRAMAAYFMRFNYKYNAFGFNCEAFVACCYGHFDKAFEDEEDLKGDTKKVEAAYSKFQLQPCVESKIELVESFRKFCQKLLEINRDLDSYEITTGNLLRSYKALVPGRMTEFLDECVNYCKIRTERTSKKRGQDRTAGATVIPPRNTTDTYAWWSGFVSAATTFPQGPNAATRAQTNSKGTTEAADLTRERCKNLEQEVGRLLQLLKSTCKENIENERYEVKDKAGKVTIELKQIA